MVQNLVSKKFSYIEKNIKDMLEPLKNDQKFLRLIKYLNPYCMSEEYYLDDGTLVSQPDIPMPYDLVGSKDVLLSLFNPTIVTNEQIFIFFSHLHFNSNDRNATATHTFVLDLVIGYDMLQMGDKLRNIEICDEICKCIDNQNFANLGRCFISKGDSYVTNDTYEGMRLFITADNLRI